MNFDTNHIVFSKQDIKRKIRLPNKITPKLAELIGIILGDGCIYIKEDNPKRRKYEIFITGNSTEDLIYHEKVTIELFKTIFNIKPYIRKVKNVNAIRVCVTSKAIVNFLVKCAGLTSGNKKLNDIKIPEYFLTINDKKLNSHLIRGLADTDFCLKFKKRRQIKYNKNHYHPLIIGNFGSPSIVNHLSSLLQKIGIANHIEKSKNRESYSVVVVGKKNLERWMVIIGFDNPKHKTKYLIWKKYGFCPPKTSLELRQKVLKEEISIFS